MAYVDPIEMESFGPGARNARQTGQNTNRLAGALGQAQQRGGVLLKTLNDIVGPLALAGGAALALVGALNKAVLGSERLQKALEEARKRMDYRMEFRALLGGLGAAQQRMAQLAKWKSPFKFDDAVQGNKNLQVLSGGLLATERGMNLVGDAAAGTKTPFVEFSAIVGGLYANLRDGRPVEILAEQLAATGAISESTARQVTSLAASGATLGTTWTIVESDLQRSAGAMKALSAEVAGLEAKLQNAQDQQSAAIGEQFAAGQKAGLEAQIAATEAMTPVLKNTATILGTVWSWWQKVKAAVVEFTVALPGLKGGLVGVITAFSFLVAALAAFSVAQTIFMMVALTRSLVVWAATSAAAAGATGVFARAVTFLAARLAVLLGPVGWIAVGVSALIGVFASAAIEAGNFGKEQENLRAAVDETNRAIREQIENIKTMADRTAAVSRAYQNLLDAQKRLQAARADRAAKAGNLNPFDDKAADQAVRDREADVASAQDIYDEAHRVATDTLGMDEERLQLAKQRLEIERQIREQAIEAQIQNLSGAAKVEALEKRAQEKDAAYQAALNEEKARNADIAATEQTRDEMNAARMRKEAAAADLQARGIDLDKAEAVGRRGRGPVATAYVQAKDAEAAAAAKLDAYQASSPVFRAQQDLERLQRNKASGAEIARAQLALEQARKQMDPNRALGEKGAADAALRQGQLDFAGGEAQDEADRRHAETERFMAGLASSSAGRLDDLRKENELLGRQQALVEAIAQAQREGDGARVADLQTQLARAGGAGKTRGQIENEMSSNQAAQQQIRNQQEDVLSGARVRALRLLEQTASGGASRRYRAMADAEEDSQGMKRRERELREQGFSAGDAASMARRDTQLAAASRELDRAGTPAVSSMSRIGGAAGGALASDVPKRILDVTQKIYAELRSGNAGSDPNRRWDDE